MITVSIKRSGYENIVIDCPMCNDEIIFNRASDLQTFEPIAGANISCYKCDGEFWINGDSINERHEALLFDCHDHLFAKRYMNCILNVCQAYEMFFSLYLRVNLLYRPFVNDHHKGGASTNALNARFRELARETKRFSFVEMRDTFLALLVRADGPVSLEEAKAHIDCLRTHRCPKDDDLKGGRDKRISELLLRVKRTQINEMRNDVVHKNGYRPGRSEAETALKEARSVLFPLTFLLDLHDDVNWYLGRER